jgi:hybrid cluster-associated redox disulfide protein
MRHTRLGGIKKTDLMAEIIRRFPQAAKVLISEYGLHCVGCGMAGYETLEAGLTVHGFSKKEMNKIVKKLNQML